MLFMEIALKMIHFIVLFYSVYIFFLDKKMLAFWHVGFVLISASRLAKQIIGLCIKKVKADLEKFHKKPHKILNAVIMKVPRNRTTHDRTNFQ